LGEVSSNYDDEKIDIDKPVNCKEDLDEIKNIFDQIDELDQLMIEEEDDESETVIENSNKNFGSKSEITLESIAKSKNRWLRSCRLTTMSRRA